MGFGHVAVVVLCGRVGEAELGEFGKDVVRVLADTAIMGSVVASPIHAILAWTFTQASLCMTLMGKGAAYLLSMYWWLNWRDMLSTPFHDWTSTPKVELSQVFVHVVGGCRPTAHSTQQCVEPTSGVSWSKKSTGPS